MFQEESWELDVDQQSCIGSGLCAATAGDHFRLESGKSRPTGRRITPDESVRDAAEYCPVEAIKVVDVSSDELVAPRMQ